MCSERDVFGKGQRRECVRFSRGWERAKERRENCSQMCQRALTKRRTLWGCGAPQVRDLRLLEDGFERGGTLISDVVAFETASKGQGGEVKDYRRVNGR